MNITKEQLDEIIKKHKKWLRGEEGGTRADLTRADLTGAVLTRADLRGADLTDAVLTGTVLTGAVLRGADLTGADLTGAVLTRADLRGADLTDAVLRGAVLTRADLRGADLTDAVLTGAVLTRADLTGADNVPYIPMNCPDYGSFIGWKKASQHIVKLQIPDTALRSSATGRKCRCNEAIVLAIENYDGTASELTEITSDYDNGFLYKVGETVRVENFDENRFNECAPGIHFFINRQEAVMY